MISSKSRNQALVAMLFLFHMFITLFSVVTGQVSYNKCLINRTEANPKRFFYYDGQSLDITLEMYSRISHQLSTHVFKIFLQEVLGYPKVKIIPQEDSFDIEDVVERLSGPSGEQAVTVPKTMINVEVWVPPEDDIIPILDIHYVRECGTIAPPIRFGWFIPIIRNTSGINDEHTIDWTTFKDPKTVVAYEIQDINDLQIIKNNSYKNHENNEYFCMDQVCTEGMFIPDQCKSALYKHSPCALLLAPDYKVTKFVIDQINELKLHVKVVWLGPNLKNTVNNLRENYKRKASHVNKKLVIMSWTPSEVILNEEKFVSVDFKRSELMRLVKFSWSKLEKNAKVAYQSLHRLKFTEKDYTLLLDLYNTKSNSLSMSEIACDWMRKRQSTWQQWIPISSREKTKLYIGGIFPITKSSYLGSGILFGALMAKEAINANTSLLRDYDLRLLIYNGQCKADMVMKGFINIIENYYNSLIGILGPACSETVESLAGVSKYYRTLVVSYSAEEPSFSDRKKYPYFFRTIGENKQYKYVYLQIFKELEWRRVAALTEDGQKYTEYISHIEDLLQQQGISFIANTKFPRERDVAVMNRYLEDLKSKRARIIIADIYDEVVRSVICEAHKLGMGTKDGYVWFLPHWLNAAWYNVTYFNLVNNETVNCSTKDMIETINGYFSLTSAFFAPNNSIMQENITVGEWRERYVNRSNIANTGISNYAGFAYDAVWAYALAVDKLIKEDPEVIVGMHSENTTAKLVNLIQDTDFYGASGHIKFRGRPSRFCDIHVLQWYNNVTRVIGSFQPNVSDETGEVYGGILKLNTSSISWLTSNGKKPDDGYCTLSGLAEFLGVGCEMAIVVLTLIIGSIVIIAVFISILVIKHQNRKKVKLTDR